MRLSFVARSTLSCRTRGSSCAPCLSTSSCTFAGMLFSACFKSRSLSSILFANASRVTLISSEAAWRVGCKVSVMFLAAISLSSAICFLLSCLIFSRKVSNLASTLSLRLAILWASWVSSSTMAVRLVSFLCIVFLSCSWILFSIPAILFSSGRRVSLAVSCVFLLQLVSMVRVCRCCVRFFLRCVSTWFHSSSASCTCLLSCSASSITSLTFRR
mmetsp:Transcript_5807/g.36055  ORF Transcript_5807/g.36055 Transcript_5807/m.36055 type:complete len:215 (-) Transcript_5807:281-925(-)